MKKLLLFVALFACSLFAKAALSDTVFVSVGNMSKSSVINVVDKVTGSLTSANVTNMAVQNNNPEYATVVPSPSDTWGKTVLISPVASGSGTAVVSCHVTYVDAGDGLSKSEDKTIVIAYTVVFTPPHGVKLSLSFN
jgi:transcriptional regulatory protein LevR